MSKTFFVDPGHEALHRGVWYGPGVMLILEEGERVEVYIVNNGKRGACIGNHDYTKLNADQPPAGLRKAR